MGEKIILPGKAETFLLKKPMNSHPKLLQVMFSLISSFSWIVSRSGWFWRAELKKRMLVPSHVYRTVVGTCKPLSASEIRVFYYPLADFIVVK